MRADNRQWSCCGQDFDTFREVWHQFGDCTSQQAQGRRRSNLQVCASPKVTAPVIPGTSVASEADFESSGSDAAGV
jgi:hypothetical protein